jgi:hypothetical protein
MTFNDVGRNLLSDVTSSWALKIGKSHGKGDRLGAPLGFLSTSFLSQAILA